MEDPAVDPVVGDAHRERALDAAAGTADRERQSIRGFPDDLEAALREVATHALVRGARGPEAVGELCLRREPAILGRRRIIERSEMSVEPDLVVALEDDGQGQRLGDGGVGQGRRPIECFQRVAGQRNHPRRLGE